MPTSKGSGSLKLTDSQRVLLQLAGASSIMLYSEQDKMKKAIVAYEALEVLGLVRLVYTGPGRSNVRLTDEGRAYLDACK